MTFHPLYARLLQLSAIKNLQGHLAISAKETEKIRAAAAPVLNFEARVLEARTAALSAKTSEKIAAWIRIESERAAVHSVTQQLAVEESARREIAIASARNKIVAAAEEVRDQLLVTRSEILAADEARSEELGEICESTAALDSIEQKLNKLERDVFPYVESMPSQACSALATAAGVQL